MTRYQIKLRCVVCHHRYRRIMEAADVDALAEMPDPPCPMCKAVEHRIGLDVAGGRVPAVGGSLLVRAVDETAKIVMEDHGMTDLRSDVREGESMAPKLPPKQQAAADNFFARPKVGRGHAGILGMPTRQVIQAAVGGRFMTADTVNPIATQHAARTRPDVHIVAAAGANGKPIRSA